MARGVVAAIAVMLYLWAWQSAEGPLAPAAPRADQSVSHNIPGGERPFYKESFIIPELEGMMAHVSSLVPLGGDGAMLASWYSGSREGAGDVMVYTSRLDPSSGLWGDPMAVIGREGCSRELGVFVKKVGNAMLARASNGDVWMFYVSIGAGGWSGASVNVKISRDGGATWGRSRRLYLSPFFNLTHNVKNPALDGGVLVAPLYQEFLRKYPAALFIMEEPGGALRYEVHRIPSGGIRAIQPAFVHLGGGRVLALCRTMEKDHRMLVSDSPDMGLSWTPLRRSGVPNPNSGLDAVALSDGSVLAAVNDSFKDRSRLSLMISPDGGASWRMAANIENTPGAEFSYPTVVRADDGMYHLSYTYERRRIKHVMFNEAWVRAAAEVQP